MSTRLSLGEYVRHLRRRKSWGLQELSAATGLSVSHLSRIENDALPNADTVVKLATALDGDLEHMLGLAKCLPKEILERLIRRAGGGTPAHRRAAGGEQDPGFAQALVDEIDPGLRLGLTQHFGLSDHDVEGLFAVLRRMAQMRPDERAAVIDFLASVTRDEGT